MTCTRKQKNIIDKHGTEWDKKYMDQPSVVYKVYTDRGSYVGITGDNHKAIELRWVDHITRFSKIGIKCVGFQLLHTFPNRFLALEMEYLLRPERNVGLNRDPGGIQGYHW